MTTQKFGNAVSNRKTRTDSPYSPHLAPCDLHSFGGHKVAILKKRSGSDDEIIGEVLKKWLRIQNSSWYKKELMVFVSRWRRAVGVLRRLYRKMRYIIRTSI
jgi:hypothetical protein